MMSSLQLTMGHHHGGCCPDGDSEQSSRDPLCLVVEPDDQAIRHRVFLGEVVVVDRVTNLAADQKRATPERHDPNSNDRRDSSCGESSRRIADATNHGSTECTDPMGPALQPKRTTAPAPTSG